MQKISILLVLFCSFSINASEDYVAVGQKSFDVVSKDTKKIFEKKGYEVRGKTFTNDYVMLKKRKNFTFGDKNGKILKGKYKYVTAMFKNGTFISAGSKLNNAGFGKDRYENLVLRNSDGTEIRSIRPDYHLAQHEVHQTITTHTANASYITFHTRIDGAGSKVGLMDGKGQILLEPKYDEIKHLSGTYFSITSISDQTNEDGYKTKTIQIVDTTTNIFYSGDFEDLLTKTNPTQGANTLYLTVTLLQKKMVNTVFII